MYQNAREQPRALSVDVSRERTTEYGENKSATHKSLSLLDRLLGYDTQEKREQLASRIRELV